MSKLEKLLAELCPAGVEYKKVGDITNYEQPSSYIVTDTNYNENFSTPVLTAGKSFILGYTNEINNVFDASRENPVIIFDDFTGSFQWVDFPFKVKSSAMKIIKTQSDIISIRYFFHIMGKINLFSDEHKRLWIGTYSSISIPVPPLPIQREIVRILDNFTELTARKEQYEYYEEKLLFNDNYMRMKISELCTVNQGLQIPINKRLREPGNNRYRYITVQFLKNKEDEQYYIDSPDTNVICYTDDILVTRTGSTGVIITGVEGCFHNNFFKVTTNQLVTKRYMYYLLKSNRMYQKLLSVASGGTVPDLPHKKFYNIDVPIPSKDEQEKIVAILDRFDTLCNDLTAGLPAEIAARQKQYEYYRDKLLTFKRKEA